MDVVYQIYQKVEERNKEKLVRKNKIGDIEENWAAKYENKWNKVRNQRETNILSAKSDSVPAFQGDYLIPVS